MPGVFQAIARIPVGLWVMIIQVFLYIDASWIYGPFAAQVRDILSIYFILFLVVFVSLGTKLPTLNSKKESLRNFMFMFIVGVIVMMTLGSFLKGQGSLTGQFASIEVEAVAIAYGFMFLHGFVKAYIEELVFRYAIPAALNLKGRLEIYAAIISSVLFGIFHTAVAAMSATAFAPLTIIYLSLLGLVFYYIAKRFGIMGSTGFHFAYNLGVLGLLPLFFGGAGGG